LSRFCPVSITFAQKLKPLKISRLANINKRKQNKKMASKKEEINLKEPVRIREKVLKDGNKSLYLDIYMRGSRKKEGLKLYLIPEVSAAAKEGWSCGLGKGEADKHNTAGLCEQTDCGRSRSFSSKYTPEEEPASTY